MKFKTFICCIFNEISISKYERFLFELRKDYPVQDLYGNVPWKAPQEYLNEMGDPLVTTVIVLKNNYFLNDVIDLKRYLIAKEIQTKLNNGSRILNLNPGYLSKNGIYLLTHKPNKKRGREKIASDMWQEKQYDHDGVLKFNKNTFSEYRNQDRLDIFNKLYLY